MSQPVSLRPRKVNNTKSGFLAPVDSVEVSNETIAAIFTDAIRPVKTQEDIYENDLLRDRLLQICMKFEAIAKGLPVLWTFIMLETKEENGKRPYKLDASELSVHDHISKSMGQALHVAFNLAVLPARLDAATRSWNALLATSDRWRSLFVRGAGTCTNESICVEALLAGDALARATILDIVDVAKRINIPCPKTHERMHLYSSKVQLFRSTILTDVAVAPSTALRYLHIASDQQNLDWSHFFTSCPNLSQLRWDIKTDVPSLPIISMPSLQRLNAVDAATPAPHTRTKPDKAGGAGRSGACGHSDDSQASRFTKPIDYTHSTQQPTNELGASEHSRRMPTYTENHSIKHRATHPSVQRPGKKSIAFQRNNREPDEDEEAAFAQLKELCRPPEPNEIPSSDCLCFMPISGGTCVVVSAFPYPLKETEVHHVYSRKQIRSQTGFDVPVLKVWVAERFIFGKVPQGDMTLVILLDLKWEEANFVAKLGFEYGGYQYKVICNRFLAYAKAKHVHKKMFANQRVLYLRPRASIRTGPSASKASITSFIRVTEQEARSLRGLRIDILDNDPILHANALERSSSIEANKLRVQRKQTEVMARRRRFGGYEWYYSCVEFVEHAGEKFGAHRSGRDVPKILHCHVIFHRVLSVATKYEQHVSNTLRPLLAVEEDFRKKGWICKDNFPPNATHRLGDDATIRCKTSLRSEVTDSAALIQPALTTGACKCRIPETRSSVRRGKKGVEVIGVNDLYLEMFKGVGRMQPRQEGSPDLLARGARFLEHLPVRRAKKEIKEKDKQEFGRQFIFVSTNRVHGEEN
ncbi:hypothetical protein R3P38DRAFT_2775090 [Favolaschia claudopus]|uniref:Uncharacterized protein n=1 Tax=Favolaschia claudopus TaxID=2862362 RepID=A0AAW0BRK4_9AGAR